MMPNKSTLRTFCKKKKQKTYNQFVFLVVVLPCHFFDSCGNSSTN